MRQGERLLATANAKRSDKAATWWSSVSGGKRDGDAMPRKHCGAHSLYYDSCVGCPLSPFFCDGVASWFSEGLTNVSPFNTAWMAGGRSAWADCLRTSPTAPAEKVSAISSECAYMLQIIALHSGRSRRRSRAASRPSTPGITRSNTTTSGRSRSDSVTAVRPTPHQPPHPPYPPIDRDSIGYAGDRRLRGSEVCA